MRNQIACLKPFSKRLYSFELGAVRPCVYFLLRGDEVVYVGKTKSLAGRISQHQEDKTFDGVLFMPTNTESQALSIESAFIHALRPPLNRQILQVGETRTKEILSDILSNAECIADVFEVRRA